MKGKGSLLITDWRNTKGPNSLLNSKSVYPQPKSGSVAKKEMGKIQAHEVHTIDDKSAVKCCLLWDQGL
eukprot:1155119-Pelagomonas_calceolata.AAC.1